MMLCLRSSAADQPTQPYRAGRGPVHPTFLGHIIHEKPIFGSPWDGDDLFFPFERPRKLPVWGTVRCTGRGVFYVFFLPGSINGEYGERMLTFRELKLLAPSLLFGAVPNRTCRHCITSRKPALTHVPFTYVSRLGL